MGGLWNRKPRHFSSPSANRAIVNARFWGRSRQFKLSRARSCSILFWRRSLNGAFASCTGHEAIAYLDRVFFHSGHACGKPLPLQSQSTSERSPSGNGWACSVRASSVSDLAEVSAYVVGLSGWYSRGRLGMSNFRQVDRQTGFLLPPSVDEWLPQRHLARFVVEVIDGLDLRELIGSYRGSGSASYHPAMLLGLLVYGYATGVFSSRKLERATYDSVAFRFIAANDHPHHDTIATFRRRFLPEIEGLFVKALLLAREMGALNLCPA